MLYLNVDGLLWSMFILRPRPQNQITFNSGCFMWSMFIPWPRPQNQVTFNMFFAHASGGGKLHFEK